MRVGATPESGWQWSRKASQGRGERAEQPAGREDVGRVPLSTPSDGPAKQREYFDISEEREGCGGGTACSMRPCAALGP